ncbi:MAG: NAD(P)/FAD-dependent oxidoreductase, partial [Candidatus Hermodarchaeota archaeon]
FLTFTEKDEKLLKDTVKLQKSYGLHVDYVEPNKIKEIIPGINDEQLYGGTHSPEDGNASPLLSLHAFYRHSKNYGAKYKFNESVTNILTYNGRVTEVKTTKGSYKTQNIVNAAGAYANEISQMIGLELPIEPESHEAGITEPVKNFFYTMIVDIQPAEDPIFGDSKNYYFYQNLEGKIIFCLTPKPNISGVDRRETSSFLPQITKRMVRLLPRLRNIKVRRTWRGLYPMTPDGNPILGPIDNIGGYINAVGMCGQGFMLGPGLGELISRVIIERLASKDEEILSDLRCSREFCQEEELK